MKMHPQRDGWFLGGGVACQPVPPLTKTTCRLVLLGPPGVGKGTQAKRLSEKLLTCHLSTGDLLRSANRQASPSPAMQQATHAMKQGKLVSDSLMMAMIRERSACLKCRGGFLLDGYPRTVRQARSLDALLADLDVQLDAVLAFELPEDELVERLSGRRTCPACRAVFHVQAQPPSRAGTCDDCQASLIQRDDDRPDAIRVRLKTHAENVRPLHEYYGEDGRLRRISASGRPDEVFERTINRLAACLGGRGRLQIGTGA